MKQVGVEKLLQHYVFVDGCPVGEEGTVICGHFQPAFLAGEAASQVFWHFDGTWHVGPMIGFEAMSIAYDDAADLAIVLGRNGELTTIRGESVVEERQIDSGDTMGPFRRLCDVGHELLALGGVRDVYQIKGALSQKLTDGGVASPIVESEEGVLEQVIADSDLWFDADGPSSSEFVAVGSAGSVGFFKAPRLIMCDVGTNLPLYCVCRLVDGTYLCGGHRGRVIVGDFQSWGEYAQIDGAGDLCSIIEFREHQFVCDGNAVYRRSFPDHAFRVNDLGTGVVVPAHRLRKNAKALLAIAGKEAFRTADGFAWQSLLG